MIRFTLNGTQIEIEDGENRTLLEYLRNVKCMKGTKEACSTGHCGACSVLVDGRLTRSCVTLVRRLDGKAVETIENAPNDTMLPPEKYTPVTYRVMNASWLMICEEAPTVCSI